MAHTEYHRNLIVGSRIARDADPWKDLLRQYRSPKKDRTIANVPRAIANTPQPIANFADVLERAGDRPLAAAKAPDKKNYAERLSRHASTMFANALRSQFPGILPHRDGSGQESKARTSKGFKKLDVNYSTPELGLGLGLSVKTINFRDGKSKRYTKNYTRVDNELRAEAMDYHVRQPWAVMIAVIYLPNDASNDGNGKTPSSFGAAVQCFRHRSNRRFPDDDRELFEAIYIGLYDISARGKRQSVVYFDVMSAPPKQGPPATSSILNFSQLIKEITLTYDRRNKPKFEWA